MGVFMEAIENNGRAVVIDFVLRKLTERKGLRQCEVARAVELPQSTFHDWTYGRVPRDLGAVKKIADYFGVDFEYLIFGDKDDQMELKAKMRKLEYENAMLKLENENQLNMFESKEEALARIEQFRIEIENNFPEDVI